MRFLKFTDADLMANVTSPTWVSAAFVVLPCNVMEVALFPLFIVTASLYVPEQMVTVSPLAAAFTAA